MRLRSKQEQYGVRNDRIQQLRHDVPTRWYSRLVAMITVITRRANNKAVVDELGIPKTRVPIRSVDQGNNLPEFITVLKEFRRVAHQLQVNQTLTISRTPRQLRELHKTLLIMVGDMTINDVLFYVVETENDLNSSADETSAVAHAHVQCTASEDIANDNTRRQMFSHSCLHSCSLRLMTPL